MAFERSPFGVRLLPVAERHSAAASLCWQRLFTDGTQSARLASKASNSFSERQICSEPLAKVTNRWPNLSELRVASLPSANNSSGSLRRSIPTTDWLAAQSNPYTSALDCACNGFRATRAPQDTSSGLLCRRNLSSPRAEQIHCNSERELLCETNTDSGNSFK